MSVKVYVDHNVRREIVTGLRRRDVDCLTLEEDRAKRAFDPVVLDRATELDRLLLTSDEDLLRMTSEWNVAGHWFEGCLFYHQPHATIGQVIDSVELIVFCSFPSDYQNKLVRIPL